MYNCYDSAHLDQLLSCLVGHLGYVRLLGIAEIVPKNRHGEVFLVGLKRDKVTLGYGPILESYLLPISVVETEQVSSKTLVVQLILRVQYDNRFLRVPLGLDWVGRSKDGGPGVQLADDSGLGNRQCLLLHHLVEDRPVNKSICDQSSLSIPILGRTLKENSSVNVNILLRLIAHIIELINATDSVVSQNECAYLKDQLAGLGVLVTDCYYSTFAGTVVQSVSKKTYAVWKKDDIV